MKQKDFTNLETFILRCQKAIRQDGDGATVLFGNTRRRQQEWLMFCPAGPRARVVGWDAEAGLTVCEIKAAQALERIAEGWFFDSLNPAFNARQHLALAQADAADGAA
ncbi:hypothetical protein [Deinococcus sp. 12RED42]|uniref:hypothetical protein n=1 Tax=Deinococcus sp. 12RED42 TaxID=2745872 RepID=UPI001E3F4972|nr:hypothetical protein [Deinococcus sp. 12RED42]MCD0167107.1 hypothetical protein [Deinococcus sp. 12RED42]